MKRRVVPWGMNCPIPSLYVLAVFPFLRWKGPRFFGRYLHVQRIRYISHYDAARGPQARQKCSALAHKRAGRR